MSASRSSSARRTEPSPSASGCPADRRPERPQRAGRALSTTVPTSASLKGRSRRRRQRERIVGSTRSGAWATIRNMARAGGSSMTLRSALARLRVEVLRAVDDARCDSRRRPAVEPNKLDGAAAWREPGSRLRRRLAVLATSSAAAPRGRDATPAATCRAAGCAGIDVEARHARRCVPARGPRAGARRDRRASPCRCPAGRRSARHGGRRPRASASRKAASRRRMADERRPLARMRRARELVGQDERRRSSRDIAAVTAAGLARSGRRRRTTSKIASSTASAGRVASMTAQRSGRRRDVAGKPRAGASWKASSSASKRSAPSPRARAAPRPRASPTSAGRSRTASGPAACRRRRCARGSRGGAGRASPARPDRRGSNPRSGRRARRRPRSSAGPDRSSRDGRAGRPRTAAPRRTGPSGLAPPGQDEPSRMCSAFGEPPGSRVADDRDGRAPRGASAGARSGSTCRPPPRPRR